jgi:hypothetical protein
MLRPYRSLLAYVRLRIHHVLERAQQLLPFSLPRKRLQDNHGPNPLYCRYRVSCVA